MLFLPPGYIRNYLKSLLNHNNTLLTSLVETQVTRVE